MAMKWPKYAAFLRHLPSAYNILRGFKEADPLYVEFRRNFEMDPDSKKTRQLAKKVADKWRLPTGDHNTRLVEEERHKGVVTGQALRNFLELPDVIFVSPYERTLHTLASLTEGWPELAGVKTLEEERIREQEHGLGLIYNDWRVMHALHPEQRLLYEIEGPYWYRYPQGENVPDVRSRGRDFMATVIREFAEQKVLAVTHHLTILGIRANQERWDAKKFLEVDQTNKPANCSLTFYQGDRSQGKAGRLVLTDYNKVFY